MKINTPNGLVLASVILACSSHVHAAQPHQWKDPAAHQRWQNAEKDKLQAQHNISQAEANYEHQLARAQDDVRSVRNGAAKGALAGGAAGAAVGGAKAAAGRLGERAAEAARNRKK